MSKKQTVKFDRESVRKEYLDRYPWLKFDKRKLDLLILRGEFLSKNPLFIKEWNDIEQEHDEERLQKKLKNLEAEWNINFYSGLYILPEKHDPVVVESGSDYSNATITLTIDLRNSKKTIWEELKIFIDKWHEAYWKDFEEDLFNDWLEHKGITYIDEDDIEDFRQENEGVLNPWRFKGNVHKDLADYEVRLKTWILKEEENKTWTEVRDIMQKDINHDIDIQSVRNWHKSAFKIIKEGVPGFIPFPGYATPEMIDQNDELSKFFKARPPC